MQRPPKKLLLYLSNSDCPQNVVIASTLAWLSKSKNYLFDNYYDSYHKGIHFGGGDSRNMEAGLLTGGTVSGDRHFGELYFLLLNFDVSILAFEDTIFFSSLKNMNIPVVTLPEKIHILYKKIFNYFDSSLPQNLVMIGSDFNRKIKGLESYLYPEIYYRKAIGILDSVSEEEVKELYRYGSKIFCFYTAQNVISRLQKNGYNVEVIDQLKKNDDFFSITKRIALRWQDKVKGWLLGDPILASHWLPKSCEEDLISIYSVPQDKILSQLGDLISSKGTVVYGRQYSDHDFFKLSKLNQCLQVIDPCRPPFQSVKHVDYNWHTKGHKDGFYAPEYSDGELKQFANENKILVSLMFWSGMIREVANFYNLMDLFAITGLRCGLVLTAQSFEYMMRPPLGLLTIPLEQGGVYSLVEPVLGSCGIGVGIESYIEHSRLQASLNDALSKISQKVKHECYMPRGWWATMDTDLEKLSRFKGPKPIKFIKYPPYIQFRFNADEKIIDKNQNGSDLNTINSPFQYFVDKLKLAIRNAGLMKYFEPYRPYEFYRSGPIRKDIVEVVQRTGLKYMYTKAGFNESPDIKYLSDQFIAMNYTSGQWDGWTPFETVNDVSDLIKSEKKIIKRKKPGWIVSTIDSCLWTFSGEFWKKGSQLYEIAQFCTQGGKSRKLINVKPYTISRYARILSEAG